MLANMKRCNGGISKCRRNKITKPVVAEDRRKTRNLFDEEEKNINNMKLSVFTLYCLRFTISVYFSVVVLQFSWACSWHFSHRKCIRCARASGFFLCLFVSSSQILAILVPVAHFIVPFSRVIIGLIMIKWFDELRRDENTVKLRLFELHKCHRLLFFSSLLSLSNWHRIEAIALTI